MTSTFKYPAISNEGGLSVYLDQIKKFPMLDAEEEYMLAKNWKTTGNVKSAEKLVTSDLRLVAKIAMRYKGYGLPMKVVYLRIWIKLKNFQCLMQKRNICLLKIGKLQEILRLLKNL